MALTFRTNGDWGTGKGANLTAAEVDGNFYDLDQRVDGLETNPPSAESIDSFTVNGRQMTINGTDGTNWGPFDLPLWVPAGWSDWASGRAYAKGDQVRVDGGDFYVCQESHTSSTEFATDTGKWARYSSGVIVRGAKSVTDGHVVSGDDRYWMLLLGASGTVELPPAADTPNGFIVTVGTDAPGVMAEVREYADESYVGSGYQWTASGAGTSEYYLEAAGGGDPAVGQPADLLAAGDSLTVGTVGSLAVGEWAWADNDALGFSTVYVRLPDNTNPGSHADGYVKGRSYAFLAMSGANPTLFVCSGAEWKSVGGGGGGGVVKNVDEDYTITAADDGATINLPNTGTVVTLPNVSELWEGFSVTLIGYGNHKMTGGLNLSFAFEGFRLSVVDGSWHYERFDYISNYSEWMVNDFYQVQFYYSSPQDTGSSDTIHHDFYGNQLDWDWYGYRESYISNGVWIEELEGVDGNIWTLGKGVHVGGWNPAGYGTINVSPHTGEDGYFVDGAPLSYHLLSDGRAAPVRIEAPWVQSFSAGLPVVMPDGIDNTSDRFSFVGPDVSIVRDVHSAIGGPCDTYLQAFYNSSFELYFVSYFDSGSGYKAILVSQDGDTVSAGPAVSLGAGGGMEDAAMIGDRLILIREVSGVVYLDGLEVDDAESMTARLMSAHHGANVTPIVSLSEDDEVLSVSITESPYVDWDEGFAVSVSYRNAASGNSHIMMRLGMLDLASGNTANIQYTHTFGEWAYNDRPYVTITNTADSDKILAFIGTQESLESWDIDLDYGPVIDETWIEKNTLSDDGVVMSEARHPLVIKKDTSGDIAVTWINKNTWYTRTIIVDRYNQNINDDEVFRRSEGGWAYLDYLRVDGAPIFVYAAWGDWRITGKFSWECNLGSGEYVKMDAPFFSGATESVIAALETTEMGDDRALVFTSESGSLTASILRPVWTYPESFPPGPLGLVVQDGEGHQHTSVSTTGVVDLFGNQSSSNEMTIGTFYDLCADGQILARDVPHPDGLERRPLGRSVTPTHILLADEADNTVTDDPMGRGWNVQGQLDAIGEAALADAGLWIKDGHDFGGIAGAATPLSADRAAGVRLDLAVGGAAFDLGPVRVPTPPPSVVTVDGLFGFGAADLGSIVDARDLLPGEVASVAILDLSRGAGRRDLGPVSTNFDFGTI